ncbi:MAG: ExbD/TolR family protein [Deltaproteobacteria bacterium]|nr:ExbD/TolR family protein [Deltaproteobacteria bacterium]MBN2670759.1 ExbD/TolR family protein [Deltaproteobacteria bacterium]
MSAGGGPNAPMSEINITPLVDVMLVLLIIFMITAPMMDDKGVELDLPKAEAKPMEVDESKLVMTIDKERRVFLGETQIPHAKLEEALGANERLQREGELYLKADKDIPYGFVVQVMAIVKKSGIPKLGMVTDPEEQKWPPPEEEPQQNKEQ